jgi:phosphoglycolate phosphatase
LISAAPVRAILFDKDGTLVDFERTWFGLAQHMALAAADGNHALAEVKLRAIGYDFAAKRFLPDSLFASGTNAQVVDALFSHLPVDERKTRLAEFNRMGLSAGAAAVAIEGCMPALRQLHQLGLRLGLATNDTTSGANATLAHFGVASLFDAVIGYDAVARPKPAQDMVAAFAAATGLPVGEIAMVGDSRHDLEAGRQAGAGLLVGVLSGSGTRAVLEPLADIVIGSVADLPDLLESFRF